MAKFTGAFSDTFVVRVPLSAAVSHFADPAQHAAHYGELERFELLGDGTVRYELPDYNYGVTKFKGHYTCQYLASDAHTVRWQTVGGDHNIVAKGAAVFTEGQGQTSMRYEATLELEMGVGRLLQKVIAPIVRQSIAREMRAFVVRMVESVESGK